METIALELFDIRDFRVNSGPFAADPPPPAGMARLYHGTSRESAASIARVGFQPYDVKGLLHRTADELGVDVDRVTELLAGTFLGIRIDYIDGAPDNAAYFTDSPLQAADWAMWGSESEVDAEAAILAARGPHRWESAGQAFNWVIRRRTHTPTVVAVDIPWQHVVDTSLKPRQPLGDWYAPPFHRTHEARIPLPSDSIHIVSIRQVEPILKREAVVERFGLRYMEVEEAISDGRIPEPDDRNFADLRWWNSTIESG